MAVAYNRYFCDTWLKIYRLPNFNMFFQLVLLKLFKSELFSCLPKVDQGIKSCKEPVRSDGKAHFASISTRTAKGAGASPPPTFLEKRFFSCFTNMKYVSIFGLNSKLLPLTLILVLFTLVREKQQEGTIV